MKKSFLAVLLAIVLVSPVFAAEKNMWVGGSFGYASVNNDLYDGAITTSSTAWSVEPEFGWTIVDRWDIGLDFEYSSGRVTQFYGLDIGKTLSPSIPFSGMFSADAKTTAIAPFVRYYLAKIAGVDIILKGSFFYAKTDLDVIENGDVPTIGVTGYGISIAPIISYSINETWSIGAKLNFAELTFVHVDVDEDFIKVKADEFGFNLNNGSLISVGIVYHF